MRNKPPISMWSKLAAQGTRIEVSPRIYCSDIFDAAKKGVYDFNRFFNSVPPFERFWMEGRVIGGMSGGFLINAWRPHKDRPTATILARIMPQLGLIGRNFEKATTGLKDGHIDLPELKRLMAIEAAMNIARAHHPDIFFKALCMLDREYKTNRSEGFPKVSLEDSLAFPFEWIVDVAMFLELKRRAPQRYCDIVYMIGKDGIVACPEKYFTISAQINRNMEKLAQEESETMYTWAEQGVALCSYAMSVMNCKNVFLEDFDTQPAKKHKKIERVKKIIFKILTIDPMSKKRRKKPGESPNGVRERLTRLHLVRGHMSNYTKGKGLFGRLHGMFFMPDHTRGSSKYGMVIKDYKIKSGDEEE